jgi:hypothetical protein
MSIHLRADRLAPVRLDLAQRRRAHATNSVIYGTRHMPEVVRLLTTRSHRAVRLAADRLAETLPVGRPWDAVVRRDVRGVLRALAAAANQAAPQMETRDCAVWLRDRLREIADQYLEARTLAGLIGETRGDHVLRRASAASTPRRSRRPR